jgi:type I restriction enzyme S subunit
LTKASFIEGGKYLAVSAAGADGRIDKAEHKAFTPVLSAIGANCGRMFLPDEDFTAIKNTITLAPNQDDVIGKFLFHLLEYVSLPIRGAGQPFISKGDIQGFDVRIPPLDEQKRIVAKLDAAMGYQTHALLNIVKSGQKVQDLSSALTAEMLIKVGMEYGEDSLGNVFNIARGGSPRPIKDFLTDATDGVNWIKISDATRTGKYITDTEQKIKPEGISRSRKVFPGDFLLSNSMSFGRPYILETEGCIHDGWLVLGHNEHEFDTEFMYYALGSKYMYDQFNSLAHGSTVRNLNIESASRARVPLPPLGVQKTLAEEFRKIDELVASQQRVNSAKREALANLNGAILSAAFVGEL